MRILLAPSAYKGSFSPIQLGEALQAAVIESLPEAEITVIPIADGGDGTLQAVHQVVGGELRSTTVTGPLDDSVRAQWLKLGADGVVELASASGIAHLEGKTLNAVGAHTFGTGQVMKDCLDQGEEQLIVCVGGSASTDGGMGALNALGARFIDKKGKRVRLGGGYLLDMASIDLSMLDARLKNVSIQVATDVSNPLLGEQGAAAIYAPQKGASVSEVERLESGLNHFADLLEAVTGRKARALAGAGAAGGTAFGLVCGLGAKLVSGFGWLSELVELKSLIAQCDLVITSEGRLDQQSLSGKATGELARICRRMHTPLWVIPAKADSGVDWQEEGIDKVLPSAQAEGAVAGLADVKRVCAFALAEAFRE